MPKFQNFFKSMDIIRIPSVKLISDKTAITGHGSRIEIMGNFMDDKILVYVTESERDRIYKLKSFFKVRNQNFKKEYYINCYGSHTAYKNISDMNACIKERKINFLGNGIAEEFPKLQMLKVEEITPNTYFSFMGILVSIKNETYSLTVLSFMDYTSNMNVSKVMQNGNYTNGMIFYVNCGEIFIQIILMN